MINATLERNVGSVLRETEETQSPINEEFRGLMRSLWDYDQGTAHHSDRAAYIAVEAGIQLGLPFDDLIFLAFASKGHDVGKEGLEIPNEVLQRGPLTQAERELLDRHPEKSRDMLIEIFGEGDVAAIAYLHHLWKEKNPFPQDQVHRRNEDSRIMNLARLFSAADITDRGIFGLPDRPPVSQKSVVEFLEGISTLPKGLLYKTVDAATTLYLDLENRAERKGQIDEYRADPWAFSHLNLRN